MTSAIVYNLEKIKESEIGNYTSLENKKFANWLWYLDKMAGKGPKACNMLVHLGSP